MDRSRPLFTRDTIKYSSQISDDMDRSKPVCAFHASNRSNYTKYSNQRSDSKPPGMDKVIFISTRVKYSNQRSDSKPPGMDKVISINTRTLYSSQRSDPKPQSMDRVIFISTRIKYSSQSSDSSFWHARTDIQPPCQC